MAELGGPLVGAFHLLLEGQRTRYRSAAGPADLLRRAAVDRAATPAAAQVVALAQALHMVPERDAALHSALGLLAGMLQRAASSVHLSESDHLLVCEALHRHRLADLTRRFAAAAIERWPQRPAFVYLEAAARFGAAPWTMPQREWQRLDRVFEQAQEQGDQRTAARLSKLLSGADGGPGSHGPMSDPDEIDDDEDMRAAFETMLAAGGVDAFLEVARRQLGKATFDQLRREVKGSKKEFALALVELLAAVEAKPPFEVRILPPPTGAGRNASAKPAKPATRAKTAPGDNRQPDFFDE